MKKTTISATILLGLASHGIAAEKTAGEKPTVIVILADDLGYADVGFQGCKDIPTPHLDALAFGGVRFTSGYVTWPACAPSRASIIAGRESHRFGFYTNPTPVLATDQGLPTGISPVPRAFPNATGPSAWWPAATTLFSAILSPMEQRARFLWAAETRT